MSAVTVVVICLSIIVVPIVVIILTIFVIAVVQTVAMRHIAPALREFLAAQTFEQKKVIVQRNPSLLKKSAFTLLEQNISGARRNSNEAYVEFLQENLIQLRAFSEHRHEDDQGPIDSQTPVDSRSEIQSAIASDGAQINSELDLHKYMAQHPELQMRWFADEVNKGELNRDPLTLTAVLAADDLLLMSLEDPTATFELDGETHNARKSLDRLSVLLGSPFEEKGGSLVDELSDAEKFDQIAQLMPFLLAYTYSPRNCTSTRIGYYRQVAQSLPRDRDPENWADYYFVIGQMESILHLADPAQDNEAIINAFENALEVFSPKVSPEKWSIATLKLAGAYLTRNAGDPAQNVEKTIELCRQELSWLDEPDNRHLTEELCLAANLMANAYLSQPAGEYGDNIEHAITLSLRTLKEIDIQTQSQLWAEIKHNLAIAYFERLQGDPLDNLELSIRASLETLEVQTRKTMPVQWAETMAELANAYAKRAAYGKPENLEDAIDAYKQALSELTPRSAPSSWAMIKNNLAKSYLARTSKDRAENVEQALQSLHEALKVRTRAAMPQGWAQVQLNLGHSYYGRIKGERAENLKLAAEAYERSLEIYRPDSSPHDCRWAAYSLGNLYFENDQWEQAARSYQDALKATDNLYDASLLLTGKQAELAQITDLYHRAAYSMARAGQLQEAVVALESGRARGISEALARDRADLSLVQQQAPETYALYAKAAARLRELEVEERAKEHSPMHDRQPQNSEAAYAQAQQARRDLNVAVESIRNLPGHEKFRAPVDWIEIVEAIQPGSPLVYLVTTPAGSLGLIVDLGRQAKQAAVELVWTDEFATDLLDSLLPQPDDRDFSGKVEVPGGSFFQRECATTPGLLALLGEKLISPVAAHMREKSITGLILIPVGRLGLLPLHAASYRLDGRLVYLLDEFDVAYAPSARVLAVATRSLLVRQTAPRRLVGIGNPLNTSTPLSYARAEIEQVSMFFASDARQLLYEQDATREALLAALPCATHVHFACHGKFDTQEPLNSHLQLANGDIFTLREVMEIKQLEHLRLAALSACETAVSESNRLPDEAIGLPGGFFLAGVPGVVGTLWSVNDLSTALLMIKFYEYHMCGDGGVGPGSMPPAAALRKAQLWLRDATNAELAELFDRYRNSSAGPQMTVIAKKQFADTILRDPEERPFADPDYWAAFAFYGV